MSATERIRAMLYEQGIEWTANDNDYVKETCWPYSCELTAAFAEYDNGTTRFACDTWCFTPEQAVAATLGPKVTGNTSDGFTFDELREEYDWMSDFMGRMTERIRGNADVHSLAAYVGKLEDENAKLREQIHWLKKGDILHVLTDQEYIDQCERERLMQVSIDALDKENAKLREQSERLFDKTLELATENSKLRELCKLCEREAENAKLRELARGLHMAYVETLNECESLDEGLIWEYSGSVEADVAKSRARFKADRHRFDAALRELGIEVDE